MEDYLNSASGLVSGGDEISVSKSLAERYSELLADEADWPALDGHVASAMVEIAVNGEEEISAAVGNGPVNALDRAARRALERFYPSLKTMHLSDFKAVSYTHL